MGDVTAMGWYSFNQVVKARQRSAALDAALDAACEVCTCGRRCLPDCPTRPIWKEIKQANLELALAEASHREFLAAFK